MRFSSEILMVLAIICVLAFLCIAAGCTGISRAPGGKAATEGGYGGGSGSGSSGIYAPFKAVNETWYLSVSTENTRHYSYGCNDNPSGENSWKEDSYSDELQMSSPVTIQHTKEDGIDQYDIALPDEFPATGTYQNHVSGASYNYIDDLGNYNPGVLQSGGTSTADGEGVIPKVHVEFEWQNGHTAEITVEPIDANGTLKGTSHTYIKPGWKEEESEENTTGGTWNQCEALGQRGNSGTHEFRYDRSAIVIHCDRSVHTISTNTTAEQQEGPCVLYSKAAELSEEHILKATLTPPPGEDISFLWLPETPLVTSSPTEEPVSLAPLMTTPEPLAPLVPGKGK
jgi:hypothetical protein